MLSHSSGGIAGISAGTLLLAGVAWWGIVLYKRSRINPQEAERKRRLALNATGKMGDAMLLDVREDAVFYSYDVRGVSYTASQDVSTLRELLPEGLSAMHGVIYLKYDPRNPANSIVVCEGWSGLNTGGIGSFIRRSR
jgi:hypothetical protein